MFPSMNKSALHSHLAALDEAVTSSQPSSITRQCQERQVSTDILSRRRLPPLLQPHFQVGGKSLLGQPIAFYVRPEGNVY